MKNIESFHIYIYMKIIRSLYIYIYIYEKDTNFQMRMILFRPFLGKHEYQRVQSKMVDKQWAKFVAKCIARRVIAQISFVYSIQCLLNLTLYQLRKIPFHP